MIGIRWAYNKMPLFVRPFANSRARWSCKARGATGCRG
jgi:hypothetical protein